MQPICLRYGALAACAALLLVAAAPASAQLQQTPARVTNPRAGAPLDLSGYWVAVVTEDWRYRMVTPEKGDFPGVPLNAAGRSLANAWDPAADEARGEQCKSYGAAAIMRVPTRLHISWVDDNTLRVETDAGTQTRVLHFGASAPATGAPSWQGYSVASWEGLRPGRAGLTTVRSAAGPPQPAPEGYLKVITTQLRPGYLRKNGVPYGGAAQVEEYFDSFKEPNNDTWLIVTTVVTDPQYLDQSFITSSQFKKLPDARGWLPSPCEAR
jgi:hypothetical protein